MNPATKFRDLIVWRMAHHSALAIYPVTANFPKQETCGLAAQMREAAVSAATNIAEGSIEESRSYLILIWDRKGRRTTETVERGEPVADLVLYGHPKVQASGFWLLLSIHVRDSHFRRRTSRRWRAA